MIELFTVKDAFYIKGQGLILCESEIKITPGELLTLYRPDDTEISAVVTDVEMVWRMSNSPPLYNPRFIDLLLPAAPVGTIVYKDE